MENVKTMRDKLIKKFDDLETKTITLSEAKEFNNTAGKILAYAKVQMEYNKQTGNKEQLVEFLKSDS